MNDLMEDLNMRNPKNTRLPQGFMTRAGKVGGRDIDEERMEAGI